MYTALERNRSYRIGLGNEAKVLVYLGREFPEDHPAVFVFQSMDGIRVTFMIEQLTILEKQGGFEYLGVSL